MTSPPAYVTPAELVGILAQQPTIILDHATLEITAPTFGLNRSLMVKRLELLNGSQIITVGVNLETDAGLIVESERCVTREA